MFVIFVRGSVGGLKFAEYTTLPLTIRRFDIAYLPASA